MAVPATSKDRILDQIRADPFISQQELASRLGLTRSAVASHIAQLTREGRLRGRAYVLPGREPILVAGGANLDRIARSLGPVLMASSNPVTLSECFGGVARNVAENLARLGLPVALMTAVGDDAAGAALLRHAKGLGIDTGASLVVPGCPTGTYTALLEPGGEMVLAMADMAVIDHLGPEAMERRRSHWAGTRVRVADCNLPAGTLAALLESGRGDGVAVIVVGVSEAKMARLPASLEGVSALILNQGELGVRVGRSLKQRAAVAKACREVQAQGAAQVVVTLGARGILFADALGTVEHLPALEAEVVDVTGAGDAFSAGVVAGLAEQPSELRRACLLGQKLAALTLASATTVAPALTPALLKTEAPS